MNDVGSRTQRGALSTAAAVSDAENLTVVVLTPVIMAKYYSIAIRIGSRDDDQCMRLTAAAATIVMVRSK